MKACDDAKIELLRMEEACRINRRHLKIIERQILAAAERMTIKDRNKVRQYGRHATTWTTADERHYRGCVDAIFESRRSEIEALRSNIHRQTRAINKLRARLGINEPARPAEHHHDDRLKGIGSGRGRNDTLRWIWPVSPHNCRLTGTL
jgi:hypothetical protein